MWRKLLALKIKPIDGELAPNRTAFDARSAPLQVGVCLSLLLAFTTATVFVRDAWALQAFQIGIFVLVAVYLLAGIRGRKEQLAGGVTPWLVYLIPLWGVLQIVLHTTASSMETRLSVLKWGALVGVFFLSQIIGHTRTARRNVLSAFLIFASAMAVLCLMQIFTSQGRVLWLFPSGYPEVFGTFQYANNYVQFVELALPIALWRAMKEGWHSWRYLLAGGILYASAIASASRAGAVLCTAEMLAILLIGLVKLRDPETGLPSRSTVAVLAAIPILAAAFTVAVGWERILVRFQQDDPYTTRREFFSAAVDMTKQHPLMGYGLGTFPEVYQRYAIKDFPFYVNHAHNDWAEFAADGGVPFLLLVLIPFVAVLRDAVRNGWALGLIAVLLHACMDYPFPRPAVSGWMYLLLGLLCMAKTTSYGHHPLAATKLPDEFNPHQSA